MKTAVFIPETTPAGLRYWPANKDAVAACVRLSKRTLTPTDLVTARSWGFRTCLTNGEDIGRVDLRV